MPNASHRGKGIPDGIVVERSVSGNPHRGKVLVAVQAHADDIPF